MTDIYWKNRPDSKKLANTLIREKLLTEKEAYLALGHQKKSIQRLGTILYTMGFVSTKDVSKALSVHTIEAIRETEIKNLFILPGGSVPPNPSELIGSKRMEFLVQYLEKNFDFIVIDTPPVMPATDAILMAPRTDGTVFVIKSGNTDRKIIQDVIGQFKTANLPIIGSVLNLLDMKKEGYYRYYNKYYSSYYGN